jgi:hypothetical protein
VGTYRSGVDAAHHVSRQKAGLEICLRRPSPNISRQRLTTVLTRCCVSFSLPWTYRRPTLPLIGIRQTTLVDAERSVRRRSFKLLGRPNVFVSISEPHILNLEVIVTVPQLTFFPIDTFPASVCIRHEDVDPLDTTVGSLEGSHPLQSPCRTSYPHFSRSASCDT